MSLPELAMKNTELELEFVISMGPWIVNDGWVAGYAHGVVTSWNLANPDGWRDFSDHYPHLSQLSIFNRFRQTSP